MVGGFGIAAPCGGAEHTAARRPVVSPAYGSVACATWFGSLRPRTPPADAIGQSRPERRSFFRRTYNCLRTRATTSPSPSTTSVSNQRSTLSPPALSARSCASTSSSRSKRSEEHTSELQSRENLVCRLLLEKKKQ